MRAPVVDYRRFSLRKIHDREYSHLKLLLFWPLYGLAFLAVERLIPAGGHHVVCCPADAWIPFCEWFLLPYVFWYGYLFGMVCYTLLYDVALFRKFMKYVMLTTAAAFAVYILYPNCQNLRPEVLPGESMLLSSVALLYRLDTSSNVCPSLHVMHSFAVLSAGFRAEELQGKGLKLFFVVATVLICCSTVFLKQHSVMDGLLALPICAAADRICYGGKTWVNCSKKKTA